MSADKKRIASPARDCIILVFADVNCSSPPEAAICSPLIVIVSTAIIPTMLAPQM